ncbi:Fic family protein [Candidatus Gottesmanbacteria bacterium]|nr:Fic family protein [Candidatus Gottesmanbacteria bacterium]
MDIFKLEKPDISKIDPAKVMDLFGQKTQEIGEALNSASEPDYLYWDSIKHKTPPSGLTIKEYWWLVKQFRKLTARKISIRTETGHYFTWKRPYSADENLHKIDVKLGGEIFQHYSHIITPYGRQRLLTKSIIEESIASSQLEGAATTTPIAKRMLLENRTPRDRSERMIVNNYKTMQALKEKYKDQKLSQGLLLEIHELITRDTLEADKIGRLRTNADNISVNDGTNHIYHIPPDEKFLIAELPKLIEYANDEDGGGFIHPVIKAIFIHFWIGYLHPFYDGNGRMARTLFYWYLMKKGYWAIQYLPISLVIKNAYIQYGKSFIYSEQDDLDITYFYDFHMRKLLLAMKNFDDYIHRKLQENSVLDDLLDKEYKLNDRQKELARYLLIKGADHYVTPSTYIELYKISKVTALKDLLQLEAQNLVYRRKNGRNTRYFGTEELFKQNKKS